MGMRVCVLTQTRVWKGMYVKTQAVNITMTKYIEVLQCNNHISSYLCDVVRIYRTKVSRQKFSKATTITEAIVKPVNHYLVKPKHKKLCSLCPKGARFLVRHRKY